MISRKKNKVSIMRSVLMRADLENAMLEKLRAIVVQETRGEEGKRGEATEC